MSDSGLRRADDVVQLVVARKLLQRACVLSSRLWPSVYIDCALPTLNRIRHHTICTPMLSVVQAWADYCNPEVWTTRKLQLNFYLADRRNASVYVKLGGNHVVFL